MPDKTPTTEDGLIAEARKIVNNMWHSVGRVNTEELENKIAQFGVRAFCAGRDAAAKEAGEEIVRLKSEIEQLRFDKEHWLSLYIQTIEGYSVPAKDGE